MDAEKAVADNRLERRDFLKLSGTCGAFALTALAGCGGSSSTSFASGAFTGDAGDLGQGDTAILNTFYAYKQLTTTFLDYATNSPGSALTAGDLQIVSQIFQHEIVHLNYLKALVGVEAIPTLSGFDFTSVPVSDRGKVLNILREFEDVGVSGWNGSLGYFSNVDYIAQLSQMAAVDARHSAAVRELIQPNSSYFAGSDVVGSKTGLERVANPYYVLSVVRSYGPTPVLTSGDLP